MLPRCFCGRLPMIRAHKHFETTTPAVHVCPRCGQLVLYGLAEGIPARVDPAPVDLLGEVAALLAGRHTYTLRRYGLVHRDARRRADPTLAAPVLAAHRCPRRTP